MAAYWIKAGLLALGLAAPIWTTSAYCLASWRAGLRRYMSQSLSGLWMVGLMLVFWYLFLDSHGRRPELGYLALMLVLSLFQLAILWWELEKRPGYRHSRDILLFRQPITDQDTPDPERGLHVPIASPAPLTTSKSRMIFAILGILAFLSYVLIWLN
jgi:hypothetical protein